MKCKMNLEISNHLSMNKQTYNKNIVMVKGMVVVHHHGVSHRRESQSERRIFSISWKMIHRNSHRRSCQCKKKHYKNITLQSKPETPIFIAIILAKQIEPLPKTKLLNDKIKNYFKITLDFLESVFV